jgi:pyrophosphatase PpaX
VIESHGNSSPVSPLPLSTPVSSVARPLDELSASVVAVLSPLLPVSTAVVVAVVDVVIVPVLPLLSLPDAPVVSAPVVPSSSAGHPVATSADAANTAGKVNPCPITRAMAGKIASRHVKASAQTTMDEHRRVRAVAFDLDGTLLDTTGLIVDSFVHVCETHGLAALTRDHWEQGIGLPLRDAFAPHARDALHLDELVACYRAYNLAHHDTRVSAYDGVPELIASLRQRGLGMSVVSNKLRATVHRGLVVTGIVEAFTIVIGLDDMAKPKPDPEAILRVADVHGVAPHELAVVGDSPFDMQAARAAGALAIGVVWGPGRRERLLDAGAHRLADTPAELLALL